MSPGFRIALAPVGEVDHIVPTTLGEDLPGIIMVPVEEYPALPLNPEHLVITRGQYLADGLLEDLSRLVRSGETILLGITEADLFSPGMNFVFGIANTGRALISTCRLRPDFWGQGTNPVVFRRRVLVEAVHELGHALGLPHCDYPGCVMYFSNWIGDTDRKGPGFCFRCARKLERLLETGGS